MNQTRNLVFYLNRRALWSFDEKHYDSCWPLFIQFERKLEVLRDSGKKEYGKVKPDGGDQVK